MRTEIVYSLIALGGAIPVTVNAANVNVAAGEISGQNESGVVIVGAGEGITQNFGKLQKGNYTLKGTIKTRMYKVTVEIGNAQPVHFSASENEQTVNIAFELTEETEVKLKVTSESTASGSEFNFSNPKLELTFDFDAAKTALTTAANTVKTKIEGYTYAPSSKQADIETYNGIIADIEAIKATYADFASNGLYNLENCELMQRINALGENTANKQKNKENSDAYQAVRSAIDNMTTAYNTAVKTMATELTDAAGYLLEAAKKKLDDNIKSKIDDATAANNTSNQQGTAVADKDTNIGKLPTQAAIDAIVDDYKTQATSNKNAYTTLTGKVTTLNNSLKTVTDGAAYKAQGTNFATEKQAADNAIAAVNAKVTEAYNSADQLTLNVETEVEAANTAINTLKTKVEKAYEQANAQAAIDALIAEVQAKFDAAKAAVDAKVSADGNYKAADYCTDYVEVIQGDIDAKKPGDGVTDLVAYKNSLDFTEIETAIEYYQTQAIAAVDYYDRLQEDIADYQTQLDAVRAIFEGKDYYENESNIYDFKFKLDLLQKQINDITAEIDAAKNKTGNDHLTAMLNVENREPELTTSFTSIAELDGQSFAIVNAEDGKALYGTTNQGLAYNTTNKALQFTNSGFVFKIEASTATGAYRLRLYTPAGEAYYYAPSWNADGKCYLNTQALTGTVSFVASTEGKGEGKDIENGAAWNIEYVAGKGFTLKNVGTGKYLKDASNAKYDEPTYFNFQEVDATNSITKAIADVAAQEVKADNNWTAEQLNEGDVKTLEEKIAAFKTDNLGDAESYFSGQEVAIQAALSVLKQNITSANKEDAATAELLAGYAAELKAILEKQNDLESAAKVISDGVKANGSKKSTLSEKATNINSRLSTFSNTYLQDENVLGLAYGRIKTEYYAIDEALLPATIAINEVLPENVTKDVTDKVGTEKDDWKTTLTFGEGENNVKQGNGMIEAYKKTCEGTGTVLSQEITGLANGVYKVVLRANANFTSGRGFDSDLVDGATDAAYVFANDKKVNVVSHVSSNWTIAEYTIDNVVITDGKLTIGLGKYKAQTNWNAIQISSLTAYSTEADAATLAAQDEVLNGKGEVKGLDARLKAIEEEAPIIKTAVAKNDEIKATADGVINALTEYLTTKTKGLADVTNANGLYDGYSNAVARKAVNGKYWWVYQSGLDEDKTFKAEKQAVEDAIAAVQAAVNDAFANETLATQFTNTGTNDKPNYSIKGIGDNASETYTESNINAMVDAIVTKAAFESKNYWAYRNAVKNNDEGDKGLGKAVENVTVGLAEIAGQGAAAHYAEVAQGYADQRTNILSRMVASLNARTAQETMGDSKKGFIKEIIDLKTRVNALQAEAEANYAKYEEQQMDYTETVQLWNDVKAIIDADDTSKKQDYLDQLNAIFTELSAKGDALFDNYKEGKAEESAVDFAAIKGQINNVKAQQSENYIASVATDNQDAHISFMGGTTSDGKEVKGAIKQANEVYQQAVQDRATYSSSNAAIKDAIDAAAAELDAALYSCPAEIKKLTDEEKEAYENVASPDKFEVDQFNTRALKIEQDITAALKDFKGAVKTAIEGVWTPKKESYNSKLDQAKDAISNYSDKAQEKAFEDVEDLIARGDAGVNSMTLSEVEAAVSSLDNAETGIDAMLATDKNAAAEKDLTPLFTEVETEYNRVKTYIEGVNIADDVNSVKTTQLQNLENAYDAEGETSTSDVAYAKTLQKNFANHDIILGILNNFKTTATNCENAVKTAVENDVANTKAYNELKEALAPVEANLTEAKNKVAQYKYSTSFSGAEEELSNIKKYIEDSKTNGSAVGDKNARKEQIGNLSNMINNLLSSAFNEEKNNLPADITELKSQYNKYVGANGLNATAETFQTNIGKYETELSSIAVKEVDDPADGINYNDYIAATNALLTLQQNIAGLQSELLTANSSADNATVLANLQQQLGELEQTASLDGYDEWVGQQTLNGKTLQEQITALTQQISDVKTAINAEKNIAFYKNQYQKQIDDIKTALDPVANEITRLNGIFNANAAAYATLSAQIEELQGKIDAAKQKVGAYEYASDDYTYIIESYNNEKVLISGAQYDLNTAKAAIDEANGNKSLTAESVVNGKANIETIIQKYLDYSAYAELKCQQDNLKDLLTNAIPTHTDAEKVYSNALWARLVAIRTEISNDLQTLYDAIQYSSKSYDQQQNEKPVTSDADYASQMQTVAEIKAKIEALSVAVDNLGLLGDANEDGKVNVLDYQKVANMILDPSLQPEEKSDLFANLDINASEVIEVGDLTALVNYILNGDWQGYASARSMSIAGESLDMSMSKTQQGTQRIAVSLENVSRYTAFQLDVVLPEGMTIVGSELSDRAADSHRLMSRKQQDGSVRFLASSIKAETFSGNEGAVLYIDVETNGEYMGGSAQLQNILFSDENAQTRTFAIGSETTGIDTMSTFEQLKQKVYDLGGRVKDGLKKGINIIRRADGKTEKVVK